VLITAVSHQAIHNALGETYWVGQRLARCAAFLEDGIVKLGASRGNNEGLPAGVRAVFRAPRSRSPLVAGATVYAAMKPGAELFDRDYDVVLFDEAGQATLVLALGARLLGKRVVFIGDDAQLPPVIETPPDENIGSLARSSALSFIRRMYAPPFLLAESRRLNSELCSVVSGLFYGGGLSPTEEAADRSLPLLQGPAGAFSEMLRPDKSLVFVDVPHKDCRSGSESEAAWAAALVREAARCGVRPEEIGVIAPFRAQANRIRFLLGRARGTVCSTVERFQGQEREMTVLSLTSSQPRYLARLAAFIFDPNRLNVAVSRARTKVVVLGSRDALSKAAESCEPDSEAAAGFSAFRRILEAAHPVSVDLTPPAVAETGGPAPAEDTFEPGEEVQHPRFGPGRVVSRSRQPVDGLQEWVHEIRFSDGKVRRVVPRLSKPPMRRLS
jgi:DNA replication ATP-dependent helicase Dna2